jgi:hypothetical protein
MEPTVHLVFLHYLADADLHIDATYEGGRSGNARDDPFPALLRMSNQVDFVTAATSTATCRCFC